MTRRTHILAGLGAAILCTPNPLYGAAVLSGSFFPDAFDWTISGRNRTVWKMVHRKGSHNPIIYLFLLLCLFAVFPSGPTKELVQFFVVGCFVHLLLDLMTPMGLPVIPCSPGKKRISLRLIKTGSLIDTLIIGPAFLLIPLVLQISYFHWDYTAYWQKLTPTVQMVFNEWKSWNIF